MCHAYACPGWLSSMQDSTFPRLLKQVNLQMLGQWCTSPSSIASQSVWAWLAIVGGPQPQSSSAGMRRIRGPVRDEARIGVKTRDVATDCPSRNCLAKRMKAIREQYIAMINRDKVSRDLWYKIRQVFVGEESTRHPLWLDTWNSLLSVITLGRYHVRSCIIS